MQNPRKAHTSSLKIQIFLYVPKNMYLRYVNKLMYLIFAQHNSSGQAISAILLQGVQSTWVPPAKRDSRMIDAQSKSNIRMHTMTILQVLMTFLTTWTKCLISVLCTPTNIGYINSLLITAISKSTNIQVRSNDHKKNVVVSWVFNWTGQWLRPVLTFEATQIAYFLSIFVWIPS